jgi:hypothetical protein
VCADETAARALSLAVECGSGDAQADAIELAGACDDVACFEAEAAKRGATHLLLVHGAWVDGFVLGGTLRALAGPGAAALQLPGSYNPQRPRTGPQVLGILKWAARTAVGEELRRSVAAPAPVAPAPAIVAPPPAPAPIVVEERSGHPVLGWTLVGAGVVAGAAGAWLLAINGQGVSCSGIAGDPDPCARERRTLIPGVGVTVGAAVALVAGVVVLVREGRDGPPRLAAYVHPEGLMLGGSF